MDQSISMNEQPIQFGAKSEGQGQEMMKSVNIKWMQRAIRLGTFPIAEAEEKCERAKELTRQWRSLSPKPSREWVMLELERLQLRVVPAAWRISDAVVRELNQEAERTERPRPPPPVVQFPPPMMQDGEEPAQILVQHHPEEQTHHEPLPPPAAPAPPPPAPDPAPLYTPVDTPIGSPGDVDIIVGRGGHTNHHRGNAAFRALVHTVRPRYLAASSKEAKSEIAREVVREVRRRGGRFLQQFEQERGGGEFTSSSGEERRGVWWFEVTEERARDKAIQSLRERGGFALTSSWPPLPSAAPTSDGGGGGAGGGRPAAEQLGGFPPPVATPTAVRKRRRRLLHNRRKRRMRTRGGASLHREDQQPQQPCDDPTVSSLLEIADDPATAVVRARAYGALDLVEDLARSLLEHANALRVLTGEAGAEAAEAARLLAGAGDAAGSKADDAASADPPASAPRNSQGRAHASSLLAGQAAAIEGVRRYEQYEEETEEEEDCGGDEVVIRMEEGEECDDDSDGEEEEYGKGEVVIKLDGDSPNHDGGGYDSGGKNGRRNATSTKEGKDGAKSSRKRKLCFVVGCGNQSQGSRCRGMCVSHFKRAEELDLLDETSQEKINAEILRRGASSLSGSARSTDQPHSRKCVVDGCNEWNQGQLYREMCVTHFREAYPDAPTPTR